MSLTLIDRGIGREREACRGEPVMIGGGEILVILETWMLALYLAAMAAAVFFSL
jgi:hypothetical protein